MTLHELFEKIDGPQLKRQRQTLERIISSGIDTELLSDQEADDLCGLQALLDSVADIAHDEFGKDCLLVEDEADG